MSRAEDLFQSIVDCDPDEVRKWLDGNTDRKQFHDVSGSALMVSLRRIVALEVMQVKALEADDEIGELEQLSSLKARQIEVYEILVSRGQNFALNEGSEAELNLIGTNTKIQLRKIHKKFLKEISLKHLSSLITRSKLSHNTPDNMRRELNLVIAKTFEELSGVAMLEPILKVASTSDKLRVIFDFSSDFIEKVDPTSIHPAHGIFYPDDSTVLIGASKLLDESLRFEVLGHLIHELSHFAIELLYHNNSNPYKVNDEASVWFEEILKSCEAKKSTENIISLAFDYEPKKRHAELIARAPHLIALYVANDQKLREVKITFSELFKFYEQRTLVDLERQYPLIESQQEVDYLNKWSGIADKLKAADDFFLSEALSFKFEPSGISVISSNCPRLTIKMIYQQMKESKIIFMELATLHSRKIFDRLVKVLVSPLRPIFVIDCENSKANEVAELLDSLRFKEINERIVFVQLEGQSVPVSSSKFEMRHTWKQLKAETQNELLKCHVIFQGFKLRLADVIEINSEALQTIPLQNLLSSNLRIGKQLNLQVSGYHVSREFMDKYKIVNSEEEVVTNVYRTRKLIDFVRDHKVVLLSDDPGTGKTTEMKLMATKIKAQSPTHWVVYLDMKKYVGAYEKDGKSFETDEVINFYTEKILKVKDFEAKTFAHLYEKNSVVFLFDGFDEISPRYKQFNMSLAKAISSKSKNQLWISTRTHLEQELKALLECMVIKFCEIYLSDKIRLIDDILVSKGFKGDRLKEYSASIVYTLTEKENAVTRFNNLTLIRILVDIYDDVSSLTDQKNVYGYYNIFIHKIVEAFLRKGEEARSEVLEYFINSTDVMAFHRRKAVESIFSASSDDIRLVVQTLFEHSETLVTEQMARIGLMLSENSEQLHFLHRTFEEFFVVEFFNRNLSIVFLSENSWTKSYIDLFRHIWLTAGFNVVKDFFEQYFQLLIRTHDKKIPMWKKLFKENFSIDELVLIFHQAVERIYENTIMILPAGDRSIGKENLRKLWMDKREGLNVFMVALLYASYLFSHNLLPLAETIFDEADIEQMFFDRNDKGETVLHMASENNLVFPLLLDHPLYSLEKQKTRKLFLEPCDHQPEYPEVSLFPRIITNQNFPKSVETVKLLDRHFDESEFKCILSSVDSDRENLMHLIIPKFKAGHEEFLYYLKAKFTSAEFKKLVTARNIVGTTPLMVSVYMSNEKNFRYMWKFLREAIETIEDFKTSLLEENSQQLTVLTHAMVNGNDTENWKFVLHVYNALFSTDLILELTKKATHYIGKQFRAHIKSKAGLASFNGQRL